MREGERTTKEGERTTKEVSEREGETLTNGVLREAQTWRPLFGSRIET